MSQQDSSTGKRRITRIITERGTPPTGDLIIDDRNQKLPKTTTRPKQNSNQKPPQPKEMDGTLP